MLALVHSSTRIRPVYLPVQPFVRYDPRQGICVGVPSCSPLLQAELLKVVREQMPQAYARAGRELGLYVSRTQDLIDRRVEIISAARVIKLARMIAHEPNAHQVFGEAGQNLFEELIRRCPKLLRTTIRNLPLSLRAEWALAVTKRIAHTFAGSVNQVTSERRRGGVSLTIHDGVFSDRAETLGAAHAYYRRIFETMFRQLAHVDCEVRENRSPRAFLDQCSYKIVWEA